MAQKYSADLRSQDLNSASVSTAFGTGTNYTGIGSNAANAKSLLDILTRDRVTFLPRLPGSGWKNKLKNLVIGILHRYSKNQITFNDNLIQLLRFQQEMITELAAVTSRSNQEEIDKLRSDLAPVMAQVTSSVERLDIQSGAPSDRRSYRFFSQYGEDNWVVNNLTLPEKGFFLDIGTADGITYSNTYYFEQRGWQGHCFEPDPLNYKLAKQYRQNVHHVAVSPVDGEVEFQLSPISPDLSGISINHSADTHRIPSIRLDTFIAQHNIQEIDLISIDTEGTELEVWSTLPFEQVKPRVVIIEYVSFGDINLEVESFFGNLPYRKVHQTACNLIYVLED